MVLCKFLLFRVFCVSNLVNVQFYHLILVFQVGHVALVVQALLEDPWGLEVLLNPINKVSLDY